MTIEPGKTIEQEIQAATRQNLSIEEQVGELISRSRDIDRSSRLTRQLLYIMLVPAVLFVMAVSALSIISVKMSRERPFVRVQQSAQQVIPLPAYCAGDSFTFDIDVGTKMALTPVVTSRPYLPMPIPQEQSLWAQPQESRHTYAFTVPRLPPGNYEVRLTSGNNNMMASTIIIPFSIKECDGGAY